MRNNHPGLCDRLMLISHSPSDMFSRPYGKFVCSMRLTNDGIQLGKPFEIIIGFYAAI
jgi:hypothetical protein